MKTLGLFTTLALSFSVMANTPIQYDVKSDVKHYSLSLKQDLDIKYVENFKIQGEDFHQRELGSAHADILTMSFAYKKILDHRFYWDIGFSISKIVFKERLANDYVEHSKIETGLSKDFNENIGASLGLHMAKFTRGEEILRSNLGFGLHGAIYTYINTNLKLELSHSLTKHNSVESLGGRTYEIESYLGTSSIGLSVLF